MLDVYRNTVPEIIDRDEVRVREGGVRQSGTELVQKCGRPGQASNDVHDLPSSSHHTSTNLGTELGQTWSVWLSKIRHMLLRERFPLLEV